MLDFVHIGVKEPRGKDKEGQLEVFPDFVVGRSKDLMIQGGAFYAIWDEEKSLWSRDEYDVRRLVDEQLYSRVKELQDQGFVCHVKPLQAFGNGGWKQFRQFLKNVSDNSHPLDSNLTFLSDQTKKTDYASRRLSYDIIPGDCPAWDEIVGTLYFEDEREKIEWSIGSILSGDSKKIHKFLAFYGPGGTGKSTIMEIIQKLFGGLVRDGGYVETFEAKDLVSGKHAFALEKFRSNPLVAIQHDTDLSQIEDNSTLNSVVSHEDMTINEKFKAQYTSKVNAFLFVGTNKNVRITDAKSGLIRRLIDVHPSMQLINEDRYHVLMSRIDFELGAIAHRCLSVYRNGTRHRYSKYQPIKMMQKTDVFFNFVQEHFDLFRDQNGTTLKQAWELYKIYAEEAELGYKIQMHKFREALKDYFDEFEDRKEFGGAIMRSVYTGFSADKFKAPIPESRPIAFALVVDETESVLDTMYAGMPAQYGNREGTPKSKWDSVKTVLGELITTKLHFLKVPETHIVVDFDLKGDDGKKSLERNLEAAALLPPTYAELSKSGNGVHLHYIYDGDVNELANLYSEDVEIKVFRGNSSLRRKLSKCNNIAVATIKRGSLPLKEKTAMPNGATLRSEKGIRDLILRNLRKEIHPGSKPSMDFIVHILDQAYKSGIEYDVTDMVPKMMAFANNSVKNSDYCFRAINKMQLKSDDAGVGETSIQEPPQQRDPRLVFFDCEVYPNLFVVCWKFQGENNQIVRMIEPTSSEIENFLKYYKLVGFNNRAYDNHILWARSLGATTEELYRLSQRIIAEKDENARFASAWNASYADVYDFASIKKSLKRWEIDLGIPHMEMDIPWDKPVPKNKILKIVEYCCNDVMALEAVFEDRYQDFVAREILADLSGLTTNHSTRQHVMRILFGKETKPQKSFVYTDLSEEFPGYEFNKYSKADKSTYRGEVVGEGGYVYAEPGMYEDVALLDVASMHPTSIEVLNLFGPYTAKFSELKETRLALKDGRFEDAKKMLGGRLAPYLENFHEGIALSADQVKQLKAMSDAMKLVLNSTYGFTSAKFDNPARDPRNIDNIVAKRGALFMVDLKLALQEMGVQVVHIKTDSVKIPGATPDVIAFVQEFGAKYGYTFEHEATYKRMCLVNDAVFIAYVEDNEGKPAHWKAVGKEFQHPYVFKTLFTGEAIDFKDLGETKQVQKGVMHLKFAEGDIPISAREKLPIDEDTHVGRSGLFIPVKKDNGVIPGGELVCVYPDEERKPTSVNGAKGYLWVESEMMRELLGDTIERMTFERIEDAVEGTGSITDIVDMAYYAQLAEDAWQSIQKYGDADWFVKVA